MTYKCSFCNKGFALGTNLRRHERGCRLAPTKKVIKCPMCPYTTSRSDALKLHEKTHEAKAHIAESKKGKRKCPLCKVEFCDAPIEPHFRTEHGIELKLQKLEFVNFEGFETWLQNLEKTDGVHFNRRFYNATQKGSKKIIYFCFRDGFYQSSAKIRNQKLLGSNKINGYCPAKIVIHLSADGSVRGEYQEVHVGHELHEIERLRIFKTEREGLAEKISMQIPFDDILNGVHSNIGNELQRHDIVSRKDLYNIAQGIKFSTNISSNSSIPKFVKENSESILLYEPEEDNFMLGIMTLAQKEMLKKYGSKHISIDSTHGFKCRYQMTTVMVLDDQQQGFPIGFLVSKRVCFETLVTFLKAIKKRMGKPVRQSVFMSDVADEVYNAWVRVMGPAKKRLFFGSHVLRTWRKNLEKIKHTDKKKTVYQMLHKLMLEPHERRFAVNLKDVLRVLKTGKETKRFAEYFQKKYVGRERLWAHCHRAQDGVNTNKHLERMHEKIKNLYCKEKELWRLDLAIRAVMRFLREKLDQKIITANRGKLTNKMAVTRLRHKTSRQLRNLVFQISPDTWQLSADTENSKCYEVKQKKNSSCCKSNCLDCKVCIHQFECNCVDASVRFNMCVHIHYVKRKIDQQEVNDTSNDETTHDYGDEIWDADIKPPHARPISPKDLNKTKKFAIEKCQAIINQIDSNEDLDYFFSNIVNCKNTNQAMEASSVNTLGTDINN